VAFRKRVPSNKAGGWTVAALSNLYAENRFQLVGHAYRLLGDSFRAEEVVQEALVRVLLAAPELDSDKHALGYMHRAIENLCIDIFRIEGRRPNLVLLDSVDSEVESIWNQTQSDFREIIAADDAAIIRDALAMLSASERAALVMWELDGRSTEEIASELGIKETAVRHTVSRARKSLRRVLANMIVDEVNGFSALDLLSKVYKRTSAVTKKTSGIALSILLVFFAYLGVNGISDNSIEPSMQQEEFLPSSGQVGVEPSEVSNSLNELTERSEEPDNRDVPNSTFDSAPEPIFAGLNNSGVPTGFTVADLTGALGDAYFRERESLASDSESSSRQIIKTMSGAANILISQTLSNGPSGFSYEPAVSYGQDGEWVPLLVSVADSVIKRQKGGNYLFTAYIRVESGIESPIRIASTTEGRDLIGPPGQVVTRILLDSSKIKVLSQAVFVVEKGAEA
jgi:RNA polymerase sigma factor (sigma-70 family)